MKTAISWLLPITLITIFFASCSKGDKGSTTTPPLGPTTIPVTAIAINPGTAALSINTTRQLNAVITPSNATNTKITWSTSNSAVATVDATGMVTAIQTGDAVITVTSTSNPAITATASITVLKNYDVYIAGNGAGHRPNSNIPLDYWACYWKNSNIGGFLHGGFDEGRSTKAINFIGSDMYVAGLTVNASFWYVPTLWKNGTPIYLTGTGYGYSTYVSAMAIAGTDVYVAGYSFDSYNNWAAQLWKVNNALVTPISLPVTPTMKQSDAASVVTNGNDVYTAGSVFNNYYGYAAYWKNNNAPVFLSADSANTAKSIAIAVAGNDVYIVGYEGCANFGCPVYHKIWKNDASHYVSLTDASGSSNIGVTGMVASGADLYISGYRRNASNIVVALLWKVTGTVVSSVDLSDGTKDTYANAVAASGNDVFVVGTENSTSPGTDVIPRARYWRLLKTNIVEATELNTPFTQVPLNWTGMTRAFGVTVK